MIIDAYNNIPDISIDSGTTQGKDTLNVAAMNVGFGDTCFKTDDQGIWLGSDKFATAPFKVDMDGNITASSLDLSTYVSKTGTNEQVSGTIRLGTGTGAAGVFLDGGNIRITMNDGTSNILLLGKY